MVTPLLIDTRFVIRLQVQHGFSMQPRILLRCCRRGLVICSRHDATVTRLIPRTSLRRPLLRAGCTLLRCGGSRAAIVRHRARARAGIGHGALDGRNR